MTPTLQRVEIKSSLSERNNMGLFSKKDKETMINKAVDAFRERSLIGVMKQHLKEHKRFDFHFK